MKYDKCKIFVSHDIDDYLKENFKQLMISAESKTPTSRLIPN